MCQLFIKMATSQHGRDADVADAGSQSGSDFDSSLASSESSSEDGSDFDGLRVDIVALSREWEFDTGGLQSEEGAVADRRRLRLASNAADMVELGEAELNKKTPFTSATFQAVSGVVLFFSVNMRLVVALRVMFGRWRCQDGSVESDVCDFLDASWPRVYFLMLTMDVAFIAFQTACAWRDRKLRYSRQRLWRAGAYGRWLICSASTTFFLGVLSGYQLLRAARQLRDPSYRDSFLAELSDPGMVDDSMVAMPMFSSHLVFLIEWPFILARPAIITWRSRVDFFGVFYWISLLTCLSLCVIAALTFDRSVSRSLREKPRFSWAHCSYRSCEIMSRSLVLTGAQLTIFGWQNFWNLTVLLGDWMLHFMVIFAASPPAAWHTLLMSFVSLGPNLALFVDEPQFASRARRLSRLLDATHALEMLAFLAYAILREVSCDSCRSEYLGSRFDKLEAGIQNTRMWIWVGLMCGFAATCAILRASPVFGLQRLACHQHEASEPHDADGTENPHRGASGRSQESLFGAQVGHSFDVWKTRSVSQYLFSKGIGDQFASLWEIIFERKDTLKLSRLKMMEQLGEGGFGRVFKVTDSRDGANYALKIQRKDAATACAVREAKALHKLQHAYIIDLVHVFHTRDFFCIMMELCDMDLNRRILSYQNEVGLAEGLPSERVAYYMACMTLALEHMHRSGVVFRDLKPENVLTTRDVVGGRSRAKLADFGLARSLEADVLQGPGQFLSMWTGTWAFMPQGDNPDGLAFDDLQQAHHLLAGNDWYALGCCLMLMLLGERGGRRFHSGGRSVLLPPRRAEIPDVLRSASQGKDETVVDLVLALTGEDRGQRGIAERIRGTPFLSSAIAEAKQLAEGAGTTRRSESIAR